MCLYLQDIATEYMKDGNLLDYLKNNPSSMGTPEMISVGKQIAAGMLYLSKENIVHRDLALRSI